MESKKETQKKEIMNLFCMTACGVGNCYANCQLYKVVCKQPDVFYQGLENIIKGIAQKPYRII